MERFDVDSDSSLKFTVERRVESEEEEYFEPDKQRCENERLKDIIE